MNSTEYFLSDKKHWMTQMKKCEWEPGKWFGEGLRILVENRGVYR